MSVTRDRDWFERNWKWLVPATLFIFTVVCAAFISGILYIVLVSVKSSGVYKDAVIIVQHHDDAREVLGEPIRTKWYVMGSINVSGPSGKAELSIPVYGPQGNGTVHLEAEKKAGKWTYEYLILEIEDSRKRISLYPSNLPIHRQAF
ncbi:hypothetical protein EP227_06320 [bacterium]|nr:MAG: hypothetical protein EP227_06320 [bacterium]